MTSLKIPEDWSAEQTLAILDLLEALHQAIWSVYDDRLVPIIACRDQIESLAEEVAAHDDFEPLDDDISF